MASEFSKLISGNQKLTWWQEFRHQQLPTALPTLFSLLINRFPWLITLRFVGGLDDDSRLASAALANSLSNVTGMSIAVGLSSALVTLSAQAVGDAKRRHTLERNDLDWSQRSRDEMFLPLVILYRGTYLLLLILIPIFLWWIFGVEHFLRLIGQEEVVCVQTARYMKVLAPGMLAMCINWNVTAWLQVMGLAHVPPYVAAIGVALHVPANHFFMYTIKWGFMGSAAATILFYIMQPVMLLSYVFGTKKGRRAVLDSMLVDDGHCNLLWRRKEIAEAPRMSGCRQYLGLAVPGAIAISEWWASETCLVLSGMLPNAEIAIGTMGLFLSFNSTLFMFPVALSVAGAMRVGQLLGGRDATGAKLAADINLYGSLFISCSLALVLIIMPHETLPRLFAPDSIELIRDTSKIIPLLAFYIIGDGLSNACDAVLKGCGRQILQMPIVFTSYWLVGLPLSYFLSFCQKWFPVGPTTLIIGTTTGTWLHALLLGIVVAFFTDWDREVKKATKRVSEESSQPVNYGSL